MTRVGIEAMNAYGGSACLEVARLVEHRALDGVRVDNLLMAEKAVALPCEDPVTFAVNAAQPIVEALDETERARIELLVTCTESGVDFGKSLSTYVHHHLGLSRTCRLMEIKNACYSGTAGLQMATNFVLSQVSPGAKALVIATDISRFTVADGGRALTEDWSFAEPSSGAGAVAALVGEDPRVFDLDVGANGYYGFEVMDTCRPNADSEAGDSDLSLMSYLDCCEQTFREYCRRVADVDYRTTFDYLAFHTPFGGMVKGAHRTMMRSFSDASRAAIAEDFDHRVAPGLTYCQHTGNIMGATVLLALASTIDHGSFDVPRRVGVFSYGSGCCSEFYSGVADAQSQAHLAGMRIGERLEGRHRLTIDQYESLLTGRGTAPFGTRNWLLDESVLPRKLGTGPPNPPELVLTEIREYHREYQWR